MLRSVFKELDSWVSEENSQSLAEGLLVIPKFKIQILGQMALLEANTNLDITATQDVDMYSDCQHIVKSKLNELLKPYGKHIDELSNEIWMPKETTYDLFFKGINFEVSLAGIDYVLISKALKAPGKNKILILEYLTEGASPEFFELAKQYDLDLEGFLK